MREAIDNANGRLNTVVWPEQWAAMRDFALESDELHGWLMKACEKAQDSLDHFNGNTASLSPIFLRWALIGFNLAVGVAEVKELEQLTADVS